MYKVEYDDEKEKDLTYGNAYYTSLNNYDNKWGNYYAILKEKYDMCYNIKSISIDTKDICKMKFECFSNGILLSLYLKSKKDNLIEKYDRITIPNNSIFNEELIFNILKTEWLIDEDLMEEDMDNLKRRENYFKAMVEVSEDNQDIKIQFRNKLFNYFIETYESIKEMTKEERVKEKVLKNEMLNN